MTRANYALLLHGSGQQDQVAREQLEQLVLLCTQRLGAKWVVPHMVPYSTKGMHGMGWGPSGWSRTWSRTPPRGCTGWDGGSKAAALGPLISPDPSRRHRHTLMIRNNLAQLLQVRLYA